MIKLSEINHNSRQATTRMASATRAKWESRLPEIRRQLAAGMDRDAIARPYGVGGRWIEVVLQRYGKAGAA